MRSIITTSLLLLWVSVITQAQAQIYYVDTTYGNDSWSGTLPDAKSTDGPWQSINKINISSFLPGDSILFRCGETWREQLTVPSSGNSGNPITFGQYGADCSASNRPVITGADPISAWNLWSGSIYVADALLVNSPSNLIAGGSFDVDAVASSGWTKYSQDYTATVTWQPNCSTSGGCLLLTPSTQYSSIAISNTFPLQQGNSYQLTFKLQGSQTAGQTVGVAVLRNGPTYETVGFSQSVTAGTQWQKFSFPFTASTTLSSARLDFQVSAGQALDIDDVSIQPITAQYDPARQVFVDGIYVNLAQYPNPRSGPTDVYLNIAQNSTIQSGSSGSGYLTGGADLSLTPSQANDMVGAGIHFRTNDYIIDDRSVAAYDPITQTITLDRPSTYQLLTGWGYYLDNKLWMLDQAGEWYYDSGSQKLYLWTPDGAPPGGRVEVGHRTFGIDVRYRGFVVIDGLRVERAGTNIALSNSTNVTVRNCTVADSDGRDASTAIYGAIDATWSVSAIVDGCTISNSVRDGIQALHSNGIRITNNQVLNAGTVGSPKKNVAGVDAAGSVNAVINNNLVQNSGYVGIFVGSGNVVSNNDVENSCLVLDDCGAIYTSGYLNNSQITGNILDNAIGNANGRPSGRPSSAQGIYLDDFTQGVTAAGNTVINADNTVQVHNGLGNFLQGNTFYGARHAALWFQEDSSAGAIHDNQITGNILFPSSTNTPLKLQSSFQEITLTGTNRNYFDANIYNGLYTDYAAQDSFPSNNLFLSFAQWQTNKGMDLHGSSFSPFAIRPWRTVSVNSGSLITNGTFDNSIAGWTQWSSDNLATTAWQVNCGISGGCLKFAASGAVGSILISNTFAVGQGKTYLFEFKISSTVNNVALNAVLLRNGPTYETVAANQAFSANVAPQRFAFLYTATETLSNARLDIDVPSGQVVYLDNVSIREVTPEYHSDFSADSRILVNKRPTAQTFGCPDTNPARCSAYIDLNGVSVTWPVTLPGYGSQIVVWSGSPFKDADRDWVTDDRDPCPGSTQVADVDISGCAPTDLALSISAPNSVSLGSSITYVLNINNNGLDQAGSVQAMLSLASGLTPVSATPSQGSCTINANIVTCSLGAMASGVVANVSISATASTIGTLSASGSVTGAGVDTNPGNNSATVTTTVNAPDLAPTALNASKSGSKVYVSDSVINQGNSSAGSFTVSYYLSTNITYEPGTDLPLVATSGGATICTRTVSSLAVGAASSVSNKLCYKPGNTVSGQRYYVIVVDDASNQVLESNETNNVKSTTGQVWW